MAWQEIIGEIIIAASFYYVMWQVGSFDKYPEIAIPLFIIAIALFHHQTQKKAKWQREYDRLDKLNDAVLKFIQRSGEVPNEDQLKEADELLDIIRDEKLRLLDFNTPATIGGIKTTIG